MTVQARGLRPFRFGLQRSTAPGGDARSWAEAARQAEGLGYSTLTIADHFGDQLSPLPALVAAADATTTLRLGTLVCCTDFRHPAALAKEGATVDLLSDGRLELGLGAGWMTADYERTGIAFDPPGVRVARMEEAVQIVAGLWQDGPFSFAGEHFRVQGLDGRPKPVQRPRPPLLVGGGGRRVLTAAARWADIVGVNVGLRRGVIDAETGPDATADATERKLGWVREAAGPRFDDLELHVRVHLVVVTDDRRSTAELLAGGFGLTPEQALASPHALVGTLAQIRDDLIERRERSGISYIGVSADAAEDLAPLVAELTGT
ncbi:MAG: TIGR03621 family F420-dependent LLM class oxidoreductase [Acidimicrobiia bacterium]